MVSDEPVRILIVGHCGPDSYALRSAVSRFVPGASVEFAADEAALQGSMPTATLLLVNRVLDGDYRLEYGVELIRELSAAGQPRTMLISNFPDAQDEAVRAGALPGFGKREMNSDDARQKILAAVGRL